MGAIRCLANKPAFFSNILSDHIHFVNHRAKVSTETNKLALNSNINAGFFPVCHVTFDVMSLLANMAKLCKLAS